MLDMMEEAQASVFEGITIDGYGAPARAELGEWGGGTGGGHRSAERGLPFDREAAVPTLRAVVLTPPTGALPTRPKRLRPCRAAAPRDDGATRPRATRRKW
jgi:hypothetical protein